MFAKNGPLHLEVMFTEVTCPKDLAQELHLGTLDEGLGSNE
jgi:hypothetical protein